MERVSKTQFITPLDKLCRDFLEYRVPTPEDYSICRANAELAVNALRRAFYPLHLAGIVQNDSLVIGSIGKRTALAPISITDVLYILPPTLARKGSANARRVIKAGALDQFEKSNVSEDLLGIIIRMSDCRIRMIPATETKYGYNIPTPGVSKKGTDWVAINPISEAARLRLNDSLTNGKTRQLLTLLKSWRETAQIDIPSLGLEFLVHEYFATQEDKGRLLSDFKAFVAWARSRTPQFITSGSGSSQIYIGNSWHSSGKAAFWRATLAENSEDENLAVAAMQWRQLLGENFPISEKGSMN